MKLSYPNTHPDLGLTEWLRFLGFLILSDKGVRQLIDAELSWNSQMSLYVDPLSRSYEFGAVHSPARDIPVICNLDVVVIKPLLFRCYSMKNFQVKLTRSTGTEGYIYVNPGVREESRRRVCQNYSFLRYKERGMGL